METTETGCETKPNLTDNNQNNVLESFYQKKNPSIYIPVQSWEKEHNELSLFYYDLDNSDEKLMIYDNEGEDGRCK